MRNVGIYGLTFLLFSCVWSGCYSFKGTSIPVEANTFYVANFEMDIYDAPYTYAQLLSEKLRLKVRNESRLKYTETDPDIEFKGKITGFTVSPVAPQNNQIPSANRLEITVHVDYTDHQNMKNNWGSNFTFFKDFSKDANLLDVRDNLSDQIFDQLVEDVFNKAFTNW